MTAAEQDGVGLCEEAAGGSLEEHPREAAGSGSSRARGRCWDQKVSVHVTLTHLLGGLEVRWINQVAPLKHEKMSLEFHHPVKRK